MISLVFGYFINSGG